MKSKILIDSYVEKLKNDFLLGPSPSIIGVSEKYWIITIKRQKIFSPILYLLFPMKKENLYESMQKDILTFNAQGGNRKPMIFVVFVDQTTIIPDFSSFNGLCLVHFVVFNEIQKSLVFDSKLHYFRVSDVYRAIRVFQSTFLPKQEMDMRVNKSTKEI